MRLESLFSQFCDLNLFRSRQFFFCCGGFRYLRPFCFGKWNIVTNESLSRHTYKSVMPYTWVSHEKICSGQNYCKVQVDFGIMSHATFCKEDKRQCCLRNSHEWVSSLVFIVTNESHSHEWVLSLVFIVTNESHSHEWVSSLVFIVTNESHSHEWVSSLVFMNQVMPCSEIVTMRLIRDYEY